MGGRLLAGAVDWDNVVIPHGRRSVMAEYGEWNRKGGVLSDVTAQKEYGVTRDFIVKGIKAGELEFREGAVMGQSLPARPKKPTRTVYSGPAWFRILDEQKVSDRTPGSHQGDCRDQEETGYA
jgi:hypothetical protein